MALACEDGVNCCRRSNQRLYVTQHLGELATVNTHVRSNDVVRSSCVVKQHRLSHRLVRVKDAVLLNRLSISSVRFLLDLLAKSSWCEVIDVD